MNTSYLLIGGNEGDSLSWLSKARCFIERTAGRILRTSSIYRTAAWGKTDQADFLNQAVLIETSLEGGALMAVLLEVEEQMGRRRLEKYGPRIIDIDVLFFNEEIIDLPQLKVPHPEIQLRRFVLAPMEEIAAEFVHPVIRKTIRELLAECPDKGDVKKISAII